MLDRGDRHLNPGNGIRLGFLVHRQPFLPVGVVRQCGRVALFRLAVLFESKVGEALECRALAGVVALDVLSQNVNGFPELILPNQGHRLGAGLHEIAVCLVHGI